MLVLMWSPPRSCLVKMRTDPRLFILMESHNNRISNDALHEHTYIMSTYNACDSSCIGIAAPLKSNNQYSAVSG